MYPTTKFVALLFAAVAFVFSSNAALITYANYNFNTTNAAPSSTAANVNATTFSGSAASAGPGEGAFSANSWSQGNASTVGPTVGGNYFSFTVSAASPDYQLNLNSLSFTLTRNKTGPNGFSVYYSINGGSFETYTTTGSLPASGTPYTSTLDLSLYQNISSVSVRIYGWGATHNNGNLSIDDVTLTGGDLTVVPEPTTIALIVFGVGATGLAATRRYLKRKKAA
jgi:hypothetical protein